MKYLLIKAYTNDSYDSLQAIQAALSPIAQYVVKVENDTISRVLYFQMHLDDGMTAERVFAVLEEIISITHAEYYTVDMNESFSYKEVYSKVM